MKLIPLLQPHANGHIFQPACFVSLSHLCFLSYSHTVLKEANWNTGQASEYRYSSCGFEPTVAVGQYGWDRNWWSQVKNMLSCTIFPCLTRVPRDDWVACVKLLLYLYKPKQSGCGCSVWCFSEWIHPNCHLTHHQPQLSHCGHPDMGLHSVWIQEATRQEAEVTS